MSRPLQITAIAVVVLLAEVAVAVASSNHVRVTGNCRHEALEPAQIVLTCGDGLSALSKLSWSAWSAHAAKGAGELTVPNCNPSCAKGNFNTYQVTVRLSDPKRCPRQKHKVFTRATLGFGRKHRHPKLTSWQLFCPI